MGTLEIEVYDGADAMPLLALARGITKADKSARLSGQFETSGGAVCEIGFDGPLGEVDPFREFLQQELQRAKDRNVTATLRLAFEPPGLSLADDTTEKLATLLTRVGGGAALVLVRAEAP